MSDNVLSAVLTFSLLAGGSAAIGSEVFDARGAAIAAPTTLVAQGMVAPAAFRGSFFRDDSEGGVVFKGFQIRFGRIGFGGLRFGGLKLEFIS